MATREEADDTLASPDAPTGPMARILPGAILAGRYRIGALLGAGGMGSVYRCEHLALGVPVAVKIMHPSLAMRSELARRFQREARATSQLSHPNVVRVLDAGEDGGLFYIAMEFLTGKSLEDHLQTLGNPPPLSEVLDITRSILDALEAAHAVGIVHRDLKPDNVFLQLAPGGERTVKVVDFGLAHFDDGRDTGGTLTQADMVAGTPQYMSPEQCHSLAVGPSADLYAVGCILTDLLQLAPPFRGAKAIEIITQQLFLPPPPLLRAKSIEPVPPLLERLRLDLLAKAPAGRPANAGEAKARLLEAFSSEATERRLPSRKGDEPLGSRAERVPEWTRDAIPIPREQAPAFAQTVGLARLVDDPAGVTSSCVTGLAAQGIGLVRAPGAAVVVLDAGESVDSAREWLVDADAGKSGPLVVVCLAHPSAARMNVLIAAGAADVVAYPVSVDTLAKRVQRVLRRGR